MIQNRIIEPARKYWPFIVGSIVLVVLLWIYRRPKPVTLYQDRVIEHKFDSLKYIQKTDSILQINEQLRSQLKVISIKMVDLQKEQQKQTEELKKMIPTQIIKIWNDKTHDHAEMASDSGIITRLEPLTVAVSLMLQGDQCKDREICLVRQDSLKSLLIASIDDLLDLKEKRIGKLTTEFYQSSQVIDGLNRDLVSANKSIRTRNIIIGGTAGAALIGILIAIIK